MMLKKIVEVEATREQAADYLRTLIRKELSCRQGDLVEVTGGGTSKLPRGRWGVVRGVDPSDDTANLLYVAAGGDVHSEWLKLTDIVVVERCPPDWVPTQLGQDAAAVNAWAKEASAEAEVRTKMSNDPMGPVTRRGWGTRG